ncbi:TPA: hypothetical protein ACKRFG_002898 [Proteus mirabilis]
MLIKDSLTHEFLVRDNHPILPDDLPHNHALSPEEYRSTSGN